VIETHEYLGYWWLPADGPTGPPNDESKRLCGTLTITRGQAKLKVIGSFGHEVISHSEKETVFSPLPADVPRILGFTTNGKEVTLETCRVAEAPMSWPGIPTTTYRSEAALLGAWFAEGEEVTFNEIALRTSELDTWVSVSGFSQSISGGEEPDTGHFVPTAFDIHFEPPASIPIPLDHGQKATIDFGYRQAGIGPVTTEPNLSQKASLYFRYAGPAGLDDIFNSVGQLRNFLSLAVGQPETVLSVTGFKDDHLQPNSTSRKPVELLWRIPHNPETPRRPLHPMEMLFTLPVTNPSISEVMRAWFSRQDLFRPVLNLYFGMLYHPDMYSDVRFLAYAQAIETYDFRRRDPNELSPDDHRERLKEILDGAPDRWRDWLRMRLLSSNYRVLDQRIRDVLGECPNVSAKITGAAPEEQDAFIKRFKHSRNYYTHYNPAEEKKAAKGADLYLLIVQLRAVIEMSLLRELGFSCDAIDQTLDRVQRYAEIHHFKVIVADEGQSSG
jgi:hypothetical protein